MTIERNACARRNARIVAFANEKTGVGWGVGPKSSLPP